MDKRYIFKGKSDFFHSWYDGPWSETVEIYFPDQFKKLLDIAIEKGISKHKAPYHVRGWVKLMDPSCIEAHKLYEIVHDTKFDKRVELIQQMTLPGLMTFIIDMAKKTKKRYLSRGESGSIENRIIRLISDLIRPSSALYHKQFAEDLFAIKPEWCNATLSKDEVKELIQIYFNKHGEAPVGLEAKWFIPSDHRLFGFKGSIRPTPNGAYRSLGNIDERTKQILLATIKAGKKPQKWGVFKYRHKDWCEMIENQYPEILKYKTWIIDNLTDKQQKEVDNWKKLEQLLCNKMTANELFTKYDSVTNNFIGNHMKNINAKRNFSPKKVLDIINPIKSKIKKWRPELIKLYTKGDTRHRIYQLKVDVKNKDSMNKFLEMAKNGEDRPSDPALNYSLTRLTAKNTKYPKWTKQIKSIRPDWFDKKILGRNRRLKFIENKRKLMEKLND